MAPHRPDDEAGRQAQSTSWSAVNYLLRSGFSWSGHERNNAYVNLADGSFADVSWLCGLAFTDDARGVASMDWDSDGDLDLWLNNRSSPKARLMRNDHADPGHRLALRLRGRESNRDAIGARVELRLASGRILVRTVRAGVNYSVQGSKQVHFGLGDDTDVESLTVSWPGGTTSRHTVPEVDRTYVLTQGEAGLVPFDPPTAPSLLQEEEFTVEPLGQVASVPLGVPLELPPQMGIEDFDGQRHTLADYRGRPVLINLWASWCAPCRTEFDDFERHRSQLVDQGVQILACSVDEEPSAAAAAADELGLWFPSGMCDSDFLALLEVIKKVVFDRYEDLPLPTSLLVDDEGRLARIYVGPADAARLGSEIEELTATSNDLDRLRLASSGPRGSWSRPEEWIATQRGNQLVAITEFLMQGNLDRLTEFYALRLASYLERQQPPERAMTTALNTLVSAAKRLRADRPQAAAEIYRQVLARRPLHGEATFGLADTLLSVGGEESEAEAQAILDSIMARATGGDDRDQEALRGEILLSMGKPEEALLHLEPARARYPESAEIRRVLGMALAHVGRDSEARHELEAARAELVFDAEPEFLLGLVRARTGDLDGAAESFEQTLNLEPERKEARLSLARARERQGDTDEAIVEYRKYLELAPEDTATLARLGSALEAAGRPAEAIEVYRSLIAIDPADSATTYRLAWLYSTSPAEEVRDGAVAIDLAQALLGSNDPHPALLDLMAAAYAEEGRFDEAVATAQQAAALAESRGETATVETIGLRLELYRRNQAFRSES